MTTDTDTVREICTEALREAGVVALDEEAEAEEIEAARKQLNRLLKAWQNYGSLLWTLSRMSVPAIANATTYTLNPVRPLQIFDVRYKRSNVETYMNRMTRDEYDILPNKTATGQPTNFYYDRQREDARLMVWPVAGTVSGETIEISYAREIADADLDNPVDVPTEFYDATVLNLAWRLSSLFQTNRPELRVTAREALDLALAFDQEGSVFLGQDYDDVG